MQFEPGVGRDQNSYKVKTVVSTCRDGNQGVEREGQMENPGRISTTVVTEPAVWESIDALLSLLQLGFCPWKSKQS